MTNKYPITIFYDGACGVCSKEISYYRSISNEQLNFVNIAEANFDAESYGKRHEDFQRVLHAQDAEGQFYTGVEAFRRLWDSLPSTFYPLLSTFVGLPGIHLASSVGYGLFARFRHLLPATKTTSCPVDKH